MVSRIISCGAASPASPATVCTHGPHPASLPHSWDVRKSKHLFPDPRSRSPTTLPRETTQLNVESFVKTMRPNEVWEPKREISIQRIFVWPDEAFGRGEFHDRGSVSYSYANQKTMQWRFGESQDVLALMRASNDISSSDRQQENDEVKINLATVLMEKVNQLTTNNSPAEIGAELVVKLIDFISQTEQMVQRRSPGFVLAIPILLSPTDLIKFSITGTDRVIEESSRIIELRGVSKREITT